MTARRRRPTRTRTIDLSRYRSFIPEWDRFLEAIERPEPTVLRVRRARISEDALADRLRAQGFAVRSVDGLPGFLQVEDGPRPASLTLEHWHGLFYVQQASTGTAAPALGPRRGERILDLCAAPGGKTTHVAELLEESGLVVASEISESRIRGLLGNVYRLGLTNVMVVAGDGRDLPEEATFDRTLVDAPCSGEGTLRRRGGRPPRQSSSFMGYVTRAQEALLRKAIRVTRPGGVVLYVTCTFSPDENEAVVSRVLEDEPVALEPLTLPVACAPGLTRFEDRVYDPSMEGAARIYPHHFDSGGLFLARLRRLDGEREARVGWTPVPATFPEDEERAAPAGGEAVPEAAAPGETPSGAAVPNAAASEDAPPEDAMSGADVPADSAPSLDMDTTRAFLAEVYGVAPQALAGVRALERGGRLWFHTLDAWPLETWVPGAWRSISVGFRAVEVDSRGRLRATNDLLCWLGDAVSMNRLDVDRDTLLALLRREEVAAPEGVRGMVALRFRGEVVGRALATEGGIRSEIPKARAADLRQILERE